MIVQKLPFNKRYKNKTRINIKDINKNLFLFLEA